uniref:Uncharacterized protein n=1 Tax=Kalanchoe fedtschenkoi TaxID=63787 RepID=A0A7N0RCQ9_KALFE
MEREYATSSAMAYAQQQRQAGNVQQQQQQYGYPPQHPQFSQHGIPPSVSSHLPLQQFPYPPQFPPHPQHPHLVYHQQQQQPPPPFPPHVPPHLPPPPFHGHYDIPAPPPAPPPSDPELLKRIEKTLEYAIKNGPEFEAMIREKQRDNPAYSFLFGGEGYNYYQYKLFFSTRPPNGPFNSPFPSMMHMMHSAPNPMMGSPPMLNSANTVPGPMMGGPPMHQHPFPPFYEQQQQPFVSHSGTEYDQSAKPFKGLPGPLPADVVAELNNILNNLSGTKESIKGAKSWFMQRSSFAPAMAEALRERIFQVNDSEKQLHIIYLVNDILFDSLQRRMNPHELDNEALAFKPVLGSMLAVVYHNPQNKEDNQSRLQKILQFWASKEVYDQNTVYGLEGEMISGPPPNFPKAPPTSLMASSVVTGMPQQIINSSVPQWQMDKPSLVSTSSAQDHPGRQGSSLLTAAQQPLPNQHFLPTSMHGTAFLGSVPQPTNQQPAPQLLQTPAATTSEKLPPYPLFPPGLIPGMVRKMQIGSGVPYSPLSPLDIPTIIPPSNVTPTEILERVSKFFKEIGEVNPSEGPLGQSSSKDDEDEYEYKRESPVRKGGACIPPPPNLQQADPDTGTYPDGTVEQKPGSVSSGRLGLGATANPNEVSQYDDVYSSYRKQRSTNYHSSMSARAPTK